VKKNRTSKISVFLGFSANILILCALAAALLWYINENTKQLEKLSALQTSATLVMEMRQTAVNQDSALQRLSQTQAPSQQEELLAQLQESNNRNLELKQKFQAQEMDDNVRNLWGMTARNLEKSATIQARVVDLINRHNESEANNFIQNDFTAVQQKIMKWMTLVLNDIQYHLQTVTEKSAQNHKQIFLIMAALVTAGVVIAASIAVFVFISSSKIEAELVDAREKALSATRQKSAFLANMSHEIRTPMNAVLGYAQILALDSALNESQRRAVSTIERSGNHLLELINEILDISKIEAGKMELHETEFDLNKLLNDLSDMFRMRCNQAGLVWNVQLPSENERLCLIGDQGKLRQVLINLLGNAAKFTSTGSVSLAVQLLEESRYEFEVIDTGPGIDELAQKSIFKAFAQSDEGHKKGGTGLGLAIASRHIELMGGKLHLESAPGAGARFYFTLTLPPAANEFAATTASGITVRLRIEHKALVVDDNAVNRDILAHFLETVGFTVRTADDGDTALAALEQERPDIVFMDFKMPRLNGVDATKAIRAQYGYGVKIVMVSASVFEHEADLFREAGADLSLRKPVSLPQLSNAIVELLGKEHIEVTEGIASTHSSRSNTRSADAIPNIPSATSPPSSETCDLLKQIGELADCGLGMDIEEKIAELKKHDRALAETIQRLAQDFKLEEIARLAKRV